MPSKPRKIQFLEPFWPPKTIDFSRFWPIKMMFKNIPKKQEKSTRPETSQVPPRAKALRPMAWLLVGGRREKPTQKRQWPNGRRIPKLALRACVDLKNLISN